MKKIFLLTTLALTLLLTGCGQENTIKLIGQKTLEDGVIEEMMYEWREDNPELVFRTTHTFIHSTNTNTAYNLRVIDCDTYEEQGTLFDCEVLKQDGKVIYKEYNSTNFDALKEDLKNKLINEGYTIQE